MNQEKRMRRAGPIAAVVALGLLGAVAAIFYFVSAALAAPPLPAPSITSSPANPTTSTSASFTYKDSQSGVSFKCSLDSATFSTCASSGANYSSLPEGSHTFKVEAVSGTTTSSATSYTWSIVPPIPTITTEPTNPSTGTSASFKYSDTLSGVSFQCSLDSTSFSSCPSSGTSYTLSSSGSHTFSVKALSGSATSAVASYAWTVTTPAPSINSEPVNPVALSSAVFTYSDTQTGVSYKCSLDSSSYSSCPSSGTSYGGLSDATHSFSVEAQLGSGPVSPAASYTWRVDTTPPATTLTFPINLDWYNAAGWSAGCAPVGICGTASDPSGVTNVSVGILQWSSGDYWNGTTFSSSSLQLKSATGTTSWHYPLARPADGTYTVYVRATDGLGNTTTNSKLLVSTFVIKTTPPSAPTLDGPPSNPSTDTSPEITLDDSVSNVSIWCGLDSSTPVNCTGDTDHDDDPGVQGEWQFENLSPGPHCFYAWATDLAGNVGPTTTFCWTVVGKPAHITMSSGSPQSTTVHSAFGSPLVAKVTDALGTGVPGVHVTFTAPSSGASGTFANSSATTTATTNSSGLATSSTFTANTTAGPYAVAATTSGVSGSANFALTNNVGPANKLAFTTGAVSGPASSSATLGPITVQVQDSYGNPVKVSSTTTASLSSSSTGGIFATTPGGSATTFVTISAGSSTASFYYGDTHAGSPKITASSGSLDAATQTESISKASPTLSVAGPTTGTTGTPIAATSISSTLAASSGPNADGSIAFYEYGPSTNAPASCSGGGWNQLGNMGVNGNGTYNPPHGLTPSAAGNYWWYASYNGDGNNNSAHSPCPSVSKTTVANVTTGTKLVFTTSPVSGAASNGANLGPITVQVQNASGTPVNVSSTTTVSLSSNSGGIYIFGAQNATSPPGNTAVSIAAGQSSVTFYYGDEMAGTPMITATSSPLTPATQTETIKAAAPIISIVSVSNQSTNRGAAFANPLVVQLKDSFGNVVVGTSVTFTAPPPTPSQATGTFSNSSNTITVASDANGQASEAFTANSTGGQYNISVSAGTNTVNFTLLNGMDFTIVGPSGLSPLLPGTSESLNLSITNPNPESISVPLNSLGGFVLSIDNGDANTNLLACDPSWFKITASSSTGILTIGAGQTLTLLGYPIAQSAWPVLSMINETAINQDNCEGATLHLSLSGTGSGS